MVTIGIGYPEKKCYYDKWLNILAVQLELIFFFLMQIQAKLKITKSAFNPMTHEVPAYLLVKMSQETFFFFLQIGHRKCLKPGVVYQSSISQRPLTLTCGATNPS